MPPPEGGTFTPNTQEAPAGEQSVPLAKRRGYLGAMRSQASRCFLLLVDGLRPDVGEARLAAGDLPHLADMLARGGHTRAITVFPSTTSVAYLPFLTGCTPGHCNIPSIRWLDRRRVRRSVVARARGGPELLRLPGAPARRRHRAGRAHHLRAGAREHRHLHAGGEGPDARPRSLPSRASALGRAGALCPVAPAVGRCRRPGTCCARSTGPRDSCSPSSRPWTATPTRPTLRRSRCCARCARWTRWSDACGRGSGRAASWSGHWCSW